MRFMPMTERQAASCACSGMWEKGQTNGRLLGRSVRLTVEQLQKQKTTFPRIPSTPKGSSAKKRANMSSGSIIPVFPYMATGWQQKTPDWLASPSFSTACPPTATGRACHPSTRSTPPFPMGLCSLLSSWSLEMI